MIDAYIGDGARHLFRELSDPGSSSLLELNDAFVADYEHIHTLNTVGEQEVVTSRLDDVLSDVDNIDFLKFDIQGFETRALGGATDVIARTSVVHCECMFGPMYKGQGYFADIDHILRSAGFDFIDFTYLARYRYVSVPKPSSYGERLIWGRRRLFPKTGPYDGWTGYFLGAGGDCRTSVQETRTCPVNHQIARVENRFRL